MTKVIRDLTVASNIAMPNGLYFLLRLKSAESLPKIHPGQFVEVRIDGADVLLRRPISVHYVDYSDNELWLLVMKVGRGTIHLSDIKPGIRINVMFPLGNGFSLNEDCHKNLLIGGGVGVAPLLYLGAELKKQGKEVTFLLGAKRKLDLQRIIDDYSKFGEVFISTEDGSWGEKGFVTQHSVLTKHFDFIYTCGPTPMMKAVAKYAKKNNIQIEVSLENRMACGLGACLCCVEDTKEGHKCVCTEGPVFNVNELKW